MKTTIDATGRLVIPEEIRREAGLKPGMPLEVRWTEGREARALLTFNADHFRFLAARGMAVVVPGENG